MSERIIFHVDMNAFFASVEQRFNPALRGKPIIVGGSAKKRSVVAACSYEAKAFGIKNGMSIFEAQRLCPHVLLVGGNTDKYVDIAQHIFAILAKYTPLMEIFSIDEAFLDVTHTLFDSTPESLGRRIKQGIREVYGLTCSVGIGPNKLIAKVAANLKKPDGLVRVCSADVPVLMERLPIEKLCGVGPRLKVRLNDLGIMTCGDLGRASEGLLVRKFGIIGTCLKRMGQGQDESPVGPFNADGIVKSMSHCYTLDRDTDSLDEIYGTMLRLSEQVARRLRANKYQGKTIGLTIRYADLSSLGHDETIMHPTDNGLTIYETAQALFIRHCLPLSQRVRLVGVCASSLIHHERQMSFLPQEINRERVDRCLDKLANRFGEFAVVRASAYAPLTLKVHGFMLKGKRD